MRPSHRSRSGLSLVELVVVLAMLTLATSLVAPFYVTPGRTRDTRSDLQAALSEVRTLAIRAQLDLVLVIDPVSSAYRTMAISTGRDFGSGVLRNTDLLSGDSLTIHIVFSATGAVAAPALLVRDGAQVRHVGITPWTGILYDL